MYLFDDPNYKFNQTLLRLLGLWPYEKSKFERFRAGCIYVLLLSYVIVQLAQFTVVEFSAEAVIRILSDALPATIYILKFNLFFCDAKALRLMMEQMIKDRRLLRDAHEIKIVECYARKGKYLTLLMIFCLTSCIICFVIMELTPDILDRIRPLNKSRTRYLPPMNEYCLYQEKYFYPLLLYVVVSTISGALSIISVGMILMSLVFHCCAIFKISSYRIEHTVDEDVLTRPDKINVMIERIIRSVELHRNAEKLVKMMRSSYTISYIVLILVGISSLSINLFRLLNAITHMDNFPELLAAFVFVIGHQIYLFGANYGGQIVIDHASEMFNAVCKSLWYVAPVTVQKLLLFMMRNNVKTSKLSVGYMFDASLEGFTSLSSMAMSYFTVIYTTR